VKPDKVGDEEVDMPACTVSYKPQELISKISSTVRELHRRKYLDLAVKHSSDLMS